MLFNMHHTVRMIVDSQASSVPSLSAELSQSGAVPRTLEQVESFVYIYFYIIILQYIYILLTIGQCHTSFSK